MFNESEWLKLVFLLADIQSWVDDLYKEALRQLPVEDKKKFLRKSYFLSITALAHILERHYYKVNRYPHAGKFHIPVADILHYIREAYSLPVSPVPGSLDFQRTMQTNQTIGYDKAGHATSIITVLTDAGGKIVTAFPGGREVVSEAVNDEWPMGSGVVRRERNKQWAMGNEQ